MIPRLLDTLMLLSVATVTWLTVRIDSVVSLTYSDILIAAFLAAFALDRLALRDARLHPAALSAAGFMLVFLAVYLCGYFDLSVHQATTYWVKGVIDWMLHACFLVAVIAHLARRGRPLYERTISWFVWGIVICAVYGLVQLIVQVGAGINLDNIVVKGITLGLSNPNGINVYGQVGGTANIYRINALTGDPNHMGVMLCVPLLMLFPYWLAAPRERLRVGLVLAFLFAIQVLTLSRSAALGDIVGLLVLFPLIRPYLPRLRKIVVTVVLAVCAVLAGYLGSGFIHTVINARVNLSGNGTQVHFQFYSLVPPALNPHPLFGMGFNTFAVFYQSITGQANFSPHSFWIATLVETGMVGLTVYLAYFGWLLANAFAFRSSSDPDAARIGDGLLAAMLGTAAANFFYLTMQFSYFFVVAALAVSGAMLFAPARVRRTSSPPEAGQLATPRPVH